jgi:tetratricopeptide (TPR) repeat protein
LAACNSLWREGPYDAPADSSVRVDVLSEDERIEVLRAWNELEVEAFLSARNRISVLCRKRPESVGLGVLLQEVQIRLGRSPDELRVDYRLRAAREGESPASLVLAARLEEDVQAAQALLVRALELDPLHVWAFYGMAHLFAVQGRWDEAGQWIDRALAIDPGHLPSRRLEAAMLTRSGARAEAAAALERWLDQSQADALIDPRARTAAQLDLALLRVLNNDTKKARSLLLSMADDPHEPVRRLCILAGAEHAQGGFRAALEAAEAAEQAVASAGDESTLPMVQQAVLYDDALRDREAGRAAWERVVIGTGDRSDLSALIQTMRARIVLERAMERAEEVAPEGLSGGTPGL